MVVISKYYTVDKQDRDLYIFKPAAEHFFRLCLTGFDEPPADRAFGGARRICHVAVIVDPTGIVS
jgi:hypothetical protein